MVDKRRLSMRDRSSGDEFWHVSISPLGLWGVVAALLLLLAGILLLLMAYTSVLDILPGYRSYSQRIHDSLVESVMRVDSMERKIAVMLDYNDAVATIMNNNTPTLHSTVMTDTIRYDKSRILPTRADSLLRQAMEAEHGEYSLRTQRIGTETAVFSTPLAGSLGRRFDPSHGEYGVAILGLEDQESVAAIENGTVICISGEPGSREVAVQHANGYTSIYRNLSQTLVRKGQPVRSGEIIGNIDSERNDEGTATSRAMLEFELRREGTATDPEKYIQF